MRIILDKKSRVRVQMSISEAGEILQFGSEFKLHAIEPSHGFLTFKVQGASSAQVPGEDGKWVRTSFRDLREQRDAAIALAKSYGLSYCQWLRMLESTELEKWDMIRARQKAALR